MMFLYRLLMRLYPGEHRARFQKEMLQVLADRAADARQKGPVERGLLSVHEVTGLALGILRERRSMTPARRESAISSLRAPAAVLFLYLLGGWTLVDLGIHALFSPVSYAILVGGMLAGLWVVSSQRVLGARRNRMGLLGLTLCCWLGLPLALSVSERSYRGRLQDSPVEFSYRYPGGAVQATIASPGVDGGQAGWTASESIRLSDDRSLMLAMRTDQGGPPYRLLIPTFLMGISFLWRRRHSRLAVAD